MTAVLSLHDGLTFVAKFISSAFVGDEDHLSAFDFVEGTRLLACLLNLQMLTCLLERANRCSSSCVHVLIVIFKVTLVVLVAVVKRIKVLWVVARGRAQLVRPRRRVGLPHIYLCLDVLGVVCHLVIQECTACKS